MNLLKLMVFELLGTISLNFVPFLFQVSMFKLCFQMNCVNGACCSLFAV